MILYVYTSDFEPVALIGSYERVSMTRSFFGVGSWEGVFWPGDRGVDALLPDRLVLLEGDPNRAGWIEHVTLTHTGDGDRLVVKGRQLKGMLGRRLVVPDKVIPPPTNPIDQEALGWDRASGCAEAVMRHYINRHALLAADVSRRFPQLWVEPAQQRGAEINWWARYQALDEVLTGIGQEGGLGWDMRFETAERRFALRFSAVRDMTSAIGAMGKVAFNAGFGSIEQGQLIEDWLNYKNAVYYGGMGRGAARLVVEGWNDEAGLATNRQPSGLTRRERFMEAGGLDVAAEVLEAGYRRLQASFIPPRRLEVHPTHNGTFTYGIDYRLGDIVTVEMGNVPMKLDAPITAVCETFGENAGMKLYIGGRQLGRNAPL